MTDHFERLFRENQTLIKRYFFSRGCGAESDDLAQQTFLKAYRNIHGFRGECTFRLWLLRIANSLWKNHLRDRGALKRKVDLVSIDEDKDQKMEENTGSLTRAGSDPDPLSGMLIAEELEKLQNLLERLPNKQRTVSFLHYFQERDFDEISKIMSLNRKTVKSHLSQAKKKLREMWYDEPFSRSGHDI